MVRAGFGGDDVPAMREDLAAGSFFSPGRDFSTKFVASRARSKVGTREGSEDDGSSVGCERSQLRFNRRQNGLPITGDERHNEQLRCYIVTKFSSFGWAS